LQVGMEIYKVRHRTSNSLFTLSVLLQHLSYRKAGMHKTLLVLERITITHSYKLLKQTRQWTSDRLNKWENGVYVLTIENNILFYK
jgi:hypothetical protein